MGRPTDYTEELGIEVAARISQGATLKEIAQDEAMPSVRAMLNWVHKHPEFDRRYNVAQREKADIILGDVIAIVDEPVADNAQASRQRNRAEYRLRMAQMLNPAKYGQRLGIGGAPELPPLGEIDPIEGARRIAFALARADALLRPAPPKPLVLELSPPKLPPEPVKPRAESPQQPNEEEELGGREEHGIGQPTPQVITGHRPLSRRH